MIYQDKTTAELVAEHGMPPPRPGEAPIHLCPYRDELERIKRLCEARGWFVGHESAFGFLQRRI